MPAPQQQSRPRDASPKPPLPSSARAGEAAPESLDPDRGLVLLRLAAGRRHADPFERDADLAAARVDAPGDAPISPAPLTGAPPSTPAPPLVHDVLRSPGQPLDAEARGRMEGRFGRSFADVRVHADARAGESAGAVGALAYTVGRHVVFGPGSYAPRTAPGRRVLAHELAHVVQQERAPSPAGAGRGAVPLQRLPFGDPDRIHRPIIDDYRREHGLPPGGVDTSGMPAGPSDAQIKYRLSDPARLGALAGMSPWELAHAPAGAFLPASATSIFAAEFADFARAARFVTALYGQMGVTFDPDRAGVLGRAPTAAELTVLDAGLGRLLARPDVQPLLAGPGGRGVPTQAGSATPTLAGRVRIAGTALEYGIKRYQLEVTVVGLAGQNVASIDATVRQLWPQLGVTAAASAAITDQERKAVLLFALRTGGANPGFYHPGDDLIYLPAATNLQNAADAEVARHETAHLLSAGEPLRRAFVARYGSAFVASFGVPRYVPYWSALNEGVTELLSREARPPGQQAPSSTTSSTTSGSTTVTVVTGPAYDREVRIVQALMQDPAVGREAVLRAYFTGVVPDRVFQLLETALGAPP